MTIKPRHINSNEKNILTFSVDEKFLQESIEFFKAQKDYGR